MLTALQKKIKLKAQYIKVNTKTQVQNCLQSNCMVGTKGKKNRSTRRYSTKKLTPQKGSGKARKGSRSSPLLVGGSKAFIDIKNHKRKKINKKTYHKYLKYCIYKKYIAGRIQLIQHYATHKTKDITRQLHTYISNYKLITLIICTHTSHLKKATQNIAKIQYANANTLNPILINKSDLILISSKCYLAFFKKKFSNEITLI
ncbi:50S ribosomal protein L4 [Candidatus Vidania fulgoroideae]|nr:50S ribosomal protein L4 [Candidatus Vidania fulgoroideae]